MNNQEHQLSHESPKTDNLPHFVRPMVDHPYSRNYKPLWLPPLIYEAALQL